ncbi:AAA family ATPase [Sinorhizobium medicae]|nr:AAA family ATPase [Sinorhizobium medicae]
MFELSKGAISKYIRGECRRRLRLDLFGTDTMRHAAGAPAKDTGRPGLNLVAEQGRIYEAECFASLADIFGSARLIHGAEKYHERGQEQAFETMPLERAMTHLATPGHFGMELQFTVTSSFIAAHDLQGLIDAYRQGTRFPFTSLRPDIIQSKSPDEGVRRVIDPSGNITELAGDPRIGLRIIDIKLPVEPSPAHFAELAYYGMTMAGWLIDRGYADRFVVLADAAIWPGSQDGSKIRALEALERGRGQQYRDVDLYYEEFENDLEKMPAEVVLGRVIRFLSHDLREVLAKSDWTTLPLHIDGRCIGCDYLGFEWGDRRNRKPDHDLYCAPTAERKDHLSRIAGLTQGACGKLGEQGHDTIARLAELKTSDRIFDQHQNLRATRHIVHARAESLRKRAPAKLPERTGTSAAMPRSNDIRVALSADFDVGSGITFALGYRVEAFVPTGFKTDPATGERLRTAWDAPRFESEFVHRTQAILVPHKNHASEGREFLDFLTRLRDDISEIRDRIVAKRAELEIKTKTGPTIQFYLWDKLNFDQFCRMMGRHIVAIRNVPVDRRRTAPELSPMAWIFPPNEVVQEADNTDRNSPITIVGEIVRLLAADIPYHYSQTAVANAYRLPPRDDKKPFDFSLHPFFADPLSDQIPSERGHEIWRRKSPFPKTSPDQFQEDLRRVVRTRLSATLSVVDRLKSDLNKDENTKLSSEAPTVDSVFGRADSLTAVAQDSQVLYQHARLMDAAQGLEVDLLMAMPPFEREARFASIRLTEQVKGEGREHELVRLGLANAIPDATTLVFRISPRSTEAKIKEGDFNLSLMPENRLDWQHWTLGRLRREYTEMSVHVDDKNTGKKLRQASKIKMVRFDRAQRIVVVQLDNEFGWLPQLVSTGAFDLDFNVTGGNRHFGIIDPLHQDFFVNKRLAPALRAIGVPQVSLDDPLVDAFRIIRAGTRKPRLKETGNPAVDFIWKADELARPRERDLAAAIATIPQQTKDNPSQLKAITTALTQRLSLLWGPPGTGKSETAAALLVALIAQCKAEGKSLRVAITGPTWVAVDNVMRKLPERLGGQDVMLARLQSTESSEAGVDPALKPFLVPTGLTNSKVQRLLERLRDGGATVVGSTAHQLGKLATISGDMEQLFDFMLVDEASQMDVAHATVCFTTLAAGASVTVVGDNLQMAPIHPIDPPLGSEHIVGSIYDFYRSYRFMQAEKGQPSRQIQATMLDTSYRSNKEIVDFVATTGYADLKAAFPDQRMGLSSPIPLYRPADLDGNIPWSADIAKILDPEQPLAAIVHSDPYSSQRNEAEAKLVAGLVDTLSGRLLGEDGELLRGPELFKKGIGIVTPHRAQQSGVIEFLEQALQPDPATFEEIIRSVDTVERFQGQEKLVMFASFGLGDGDQIALEEEFLYDLNRFNVIVSRAKTKMVVIMSRRLVDYLPHDLRALRDSRLLKDFAGGYLRRSTPLSFPGLESLGACELRIR